MIRRPPRSTQSRSSAASDVYKRQEPRLRRICAWAVILLHGAIGGERRVVPRAVRLEVGGERVDHDVVGPRARATRLRTTSRDVVVHHALQVERLACGREAERGQGRLTIFAETEG